MRIIMMNWPDENNYKEEMINDNKQNLEPGEEPDIKHSGINGKNQINKNIKILFLNINIR